MKPDNLRLQGANSSDFDRQMRTKTLCPVDDRALFCIEKVKRMNNFITKEGTS